MKEWDNAQGHLEAVELQTDSVVDAIGVAGPSKALMGTLHAPEEERDETRATLGDLEESLSGATGVVLTKRLETLEEALEARDMGKANAALRAMISAVVVDYREGDLRLQWKHDGEMRVPFGWPDKDA